MSFAAPGAPAARRRFRLAVLAMALAALAIQLPIYDRWLPLFDEGCSTSTSPPCSAVGGSAKRSSPTSC